MKITGIEAAASDNPDLRVALTSIEDYLSFLEQMLGVDPRAAQQIRSRNRVPVPPQVSFSVTGVNGNFVIQIVNPASLQGVVYHQVRTSDVLPLDHSTSFEDTSITPGTHIVIPNPSVTKYVGVRSRLINSNFNNWRTYPSSVFSGAISSASLSTVDVSRQIMALGRPLLAQNGAAAEVNVGAFSVTYGGGKVASYGANVIKGLTFAPYYVYTDDSSRNGGALSYVATLDPSELTQSESRLFIGIIRLRDDGGAVVFSPGLRGGPAAATLITMSDGSTKAANLIAVGDSLKSLDGNEIVVSISSYANVPCFTVTSSSGKQITISGDRSLQLGPGSRFPLVDMTTNDSIDTQDGQEQITSKVYAGLQTVYAIELSRNRYHLGNGIWCA